MYEISSTTKPNLCAGGPDEVNGLEHQILAIAGERGL